MSKTNFMKDNFESLLEVAEAKVDFLKKEVYEEGKDKLDELNYWKGKLDGIKFVVSFEDDFFLLNLADHLKEKGYKDVAKYIKSLSNK